MMNSQRRTRRGQRRSVAKERLWRRHVAQQARSKLSVRQYCGQVGLSEPSFYAWRRELAERDSATGEPARLETRANHAGPAPARASSPPPTSFLPVTIAAPAAAPIELVLPSGLLVRVAAHDAAALRTVLTVLEGRAC